MKAIANVDEDYLIGMSNKGIYKRSCKDLTSASIEAEISESSANVKINDVNCTIILPLAQSKCSCPSSSTCKHIIMSILYLQDKYKCEANESCELQPLENKQPEILDKLDSAMLDSLRKAIPAKSYREFVQQLEAGYKPEFEFSSIVTVKFTDENITVKLLDSVENSTCTCHSAQLCPHKAKALICLMLEREIIKIDNLQEVKSEVNSDGIKEKKFVSEQICEKLTDWMAMGLARAGENAEEEAQQLALLAHNAKLADFERKLREISSLYGEYIHRKVSFDSQMLLSKILSVYSDCITIGCAYNPLIIEKLSGEFRGEYKALPPVKLAYICTRHFLGRSGYEGDIYYFIDCEKNKFYTYNVVRANFYENSGRGKKTQYTYAWNMDVPITQLEGKIIKLTGCKVSGDRLSSTSNAHAEIVGSCAIDANMLGDLLYTNFLKLLVDNFNSADFDNDGVLAAIKPKICIGGSFNSITQRFEMTLLDCDDRKMVLSIEHNDVDGDVITALEHMTSHMEQYEEPPVFFGRVYPGDESLMFYPIELLTEV